MITEPVLGSLSNLLLKRYTHITTVPQSVEKYVLHDLEMKYGMCQVMEALAFCHQNAHMVHGNLTPHQIFVTPKGQWKLSGFHFSFHSYASIDGNTNSGQQPQQPAIIPPELDEIVPFNSISKSSFVPSLDYAAPEYVRDKKPGFSSDIFSFGLLYCQLLRANGKTTASNADESDAPPKEEGFNPSAPLLNTYQNVERYNTALGRLYETLSTQEPYCKLSQEILDSLRQVCSINPKERPTAHFILSHCELLFGHEVKALRYLNNMEMREPVKKAQFLRSLLPMIKPAQPQPDNGFPDRILFQKILPPLLDECKDVKMTLYALPNVLAISERMTNTQFAKLVLPTLCKYVLMYTDQQAKVPAMVLQKFDLLWEKSTSSEQKNFLIPFLVRCLQSSQNDVQIEAMKRSEEWLNQDRINYHEFKTLILPDLQNISRKTSNHMVRTNCVVCLGKVLPKLDRQVIVNQIVPVLEHALKTDPSNATSGLVMSCVGVFLKITKQFGQDPDLSQINANLIASRILPAILPIATQKTLQLEQFQKYMKAIRSMLDIVENEKLNELENAEKNADLTSETNTEDDETASVDRPIEDNYYNQTQTITPPKKPTVVDPLQRILQEKNEEVAPVQRKVINFVDENGAQDLDNQLDDSTPTRTVPQQEERNQHHFDNLLGKFLNDPVSLEKPSGSLFSNNRRTFMDDDDEEPIAKANITSELEKPQPKQIFDKPSMIDAMAYDQKEPEPVQSVLPPVSHHDAMASFDQMLNRIGTSVDDDEEPSTSLFGSKYQTNSQPRFERKNSEKLVSMEDDDDEPSPAPVRKTSAVSTTSNSDSLFDQLQGRYNMNDDDDDTPPPTISPARKTTTTTTTTSGGGDLFDSLLNRHFDSDDE
jgi:SCY1-like protein 2